MKLTREEVLKLAKLSRLKLSEAEVELFQKEISEVLDFVQQLDSVNIEGLLPTYQLTGLTSENENATRSDDIVEQISQDDLFKNLPNVENGLIKVKRMIG